MNCKQLTGNLKLKKLNTKDKNSGNKLTTKVKGALCCGAYVPALTTEPLS